MAGVSRNVATAPPREASGIYPAQLYAMASAGAQEILCLAGAIARTTMAPIDRGLNDMGGPWRSQSDRSGRRNTGTWNAIVIGIPRSR